jgi:Na+-transporting NADH:ubiquinone oxidoreductase subunit NqrB
LLNVLLCVWFWIVLTSAGWRKMLSFDSNVCSYVARLFLRTFAILKNKSPFGHFHPRNNQLPVYWNCFLFLINFIITFTIICIFSSELKGCHSFTDFLASFLVLWLRSCTSVSARAQNSLPKLCRIEAMPVHSSLQVLFHCFNSGCFFSLAQCHLQVA